MPFIEITVTVPERVINVEAVRNAITQAQNNQTGPALKALFQQTVEGWHNPPTFSTRREDDNTQLGIRVYPDGEWAEKYALIDQGARAHEIRPKRGRFLRFQPGYRAGTAPRVLRSRAYVRSGEFISAGRVQHPGFQAREFTQTIADEHEDDFNRDMQEAIARAAHP